MGVDDKKFFFQKSREGRSPVATLEYAVDFDDLNLAMKVVNEGSKVNVVGWDVKNKKVFDGKTSGAPASAKMGGSETGYQVSSKFPSSEITLTDRAVTTPASARKMAEAESEVTLKNFIEGGGSCDGDPRLRAGSNLKITGVGKRFSGIYYITSCVHEYDQEQGYRTNFKVRRTGI